MIKFTKIVPKNYKNNTPYCLGLKIWIEMLDAYENRLRAKGMKEQDFKRAYWNKNEIN